MDDWRRNLIYKPPSGFWGGILYIMDSSFLFATTLLCSSSSPGNHLYFIEHAMELTLRHPDFTPDAEWYDLQLEERLPLSKTMLHEMIMALPPLGTSRVLDIGAGTGRSACAVRRAYPRCHMTLLDFDTRRLSMAMSRLKALRHESGYVHLNEEAVRGVILARDDPQKRSSQQQQRKQQRSQGVESVAKDKPGVSSITSAADAADAAASSLSSCDDVPTSTRVSITKDDASGNGDDDDSKLASVESLGLFDVILAVQTLRHCADPPKHYQPPQNQQQQPSRKQQQQEQHRTKRQQQQEQQQQQQHEEAAAMRRGGVGEGEAVVESRYENILRQLFATLHPGGHIFIGDHIQHGHPGVYGHCRLLERVGFASVDVAWVQTEWFVVGARKPLTRLK